MGAETSWISVILSPSWKPVRGFSYCLPIKVNELLSQCDGYTRIFTVGETVGSAAIVVSRLCKKRLPNNSSIFSAEARGILLALYGIHMSTGSQLLFLSESLLFLQSLQNRDLSPLYCRDCTSCPWFNII